MPPQPTQFGPRPVKKRLSVPQIMLIVATLGFLVWYLITALIPAKPATARIELNTYGTHYSGDCLIIRRGDLVESVSESEDFRVDAIYVTPEFIEISTPHSNYGMKGQLALFNNPVMNSRKYACST